MSANGTWSAVQSSLRQIHATARRLPPAAAATYRALAMSAIDAPDCKLPAVDERLAHAADVQPAFWRRIRPQLEAQGLLVLEGDHMVLPELDRLRRARKAARRSGCFGGLVKGAQDRLRRARERLGNRPGWKRRMGEIVEEMIVKLLPAYREHARARAELHGEPRQGALDLAIQVDPEDELAEEKRILKRLLRVGEYLQVPAAQMAELVQETTVHALAWLTRRQEEGRLDFADLALALFNPRRIEEASARVAAAVDLACAA